MYHPPSLVFLPNFNLLIVFPQSFCITLFFNDSPPRWKILNNSKLRWCHFLSKRINFCLWLTVCKEVILIQSDIECIWRLVSFILKPSLFIACSYSYTRTFESSKESLEYLQCLLSALAPYTRFVFFFSFQHFEPHKCSILIAIASKSIKVIPHIELLFFGFNYH